MQTVQTTQDIAYGLEMAREQYLAREEKRQQKAHALADSAKADPKLGAMELSRAFRQELSPCERKIHMDYKPSATVYLVKLGVRKKRIAFDEMFEFESPKLSRLEAQLDAERAARAAGYPIIGYVYSIDRV